jgi:hypothetical protein
MSHAHHPHHHVVLKRGSKTGQMMDNVEPFATLSCCVGKRQSKTRQTTDNIEPCATLSCHGGGATRPGEQRTTDNIVSLPYRWSLALRWTDVQRREESGSGQTTNVVIVVD